MSTNTTSVWRKKLKELEIVVVIPTYNNGKTLAAVIEEVCRYADDIIVVNDGSTDDTANILEQYPAIRTITHPVNKGKGTALKHGLSQAKKEGFRYAITIDSDGQHFASDIPCFIEAIEKEPDTLLVGARNLASDNITFSSCISVCLKLPQSIYCLSAVRVVIRFLLSAEGL